MLDLRLAVDNTIKNISTLNKKPLNNDIQNRIRQIQDLFNQYLSYNELIINLFTKVNTYKASIRGDENRWLADDAIFVEEFTKLLSKTTLGLGLMASDAIQRRHDSGTDVSRKTGLEAFNRVLLAGTFADVFTKDAANIVLIGPDPLAALNATRARSSTEAQILHAGILQMVTVNVKGKFGLFGRPGSHFLQTMREFVAKAKALRLQEQSVELIVDNSENLNPNVSAIMAL